jgi:glycosyltransferase involved in cell wall biosynthesis
MVVGPGLKILVISSYYQPAFIYGGPVPALHHLNQALLKSGHNLRVYTTNANGCGDLDVPLGQPVDTDGLPITYFPRCWFGRAQKPSLLFFSPAMGRQLQRLRPGDFDLILIHATWGDPGRMAAAAGRRTGIPYICYTHGGFEPWAWRHQYWKKKIYWRLIEKRILMGAAGIVVCNEAETAQLRALGVRTPIRRIPWGVELPAPEQTPSRERLAGVFPSLAGRPFVLFLSRLHPKKGLDLLIPAFKTLAREFPDWLLVLAGPDEGGYGAVLENLVKDLGLADRVVFTGMVTGEAKAALLTHADLFVLPSYSEGFPVVVAEAMGYGRPLVITETCYVPEVEEGGAGLVIKPERDSLTDALKVMLLDHRLRRDCAYQSRKLAQTRFSWEAVAEKSLAFYRETIQCHFTA